MNILLVNAWMQDEYFFIDIETLVIIYVFNISETKKFQLKIKLYEQKPSEPLVTANFAGIKYEIIQNVPESATNCIWPVILLNKSLISGLSSVSRQIIKESSKNDIRKLLGFREACLVACAESSIWTKFCEIDIISTTKNLMNNKYFDRDTLILPEDVIKFENHLSKPVRIHNIYKIARKNKNDPSIQSSTPREELNVQHAFAEGPYMTLADIILYPCFKIFFQICTSNLIQSKLLLTHQWFQHMETANLVQLSFSIPFNKIIKISNIIDVEIKNVSLYNADPLRTLSEKYTKQYKIDDALNAIESIKNIIFNNFLPYGFDIPFDWEKVPLEANPNCGALPEKRANRKCEQLENLARAVLKIAGKNVYKIVDFCSGSGHLGILLACLLPNCEIILVENKEKSQARAEERIEKLNLTNVFIVQSNLDYFIGTFDIGVSLHACGVATDLVIESCIKNRAHFVSCPCCYGGVKTCHQITYPRSKIYRSLFNNFDNQYFALAHAADQTHEEDNIKTKQGYLCMDVIDTDRKLSAEDCNYEVFLGKLQPPSCTNKNNLLVGICKNK